MHDLDIAYQLNDEVLVPGTCNNCDVLELKLPLFVDLEFGLGIVSEEA
jgi:hypothetical protein